MSPPAVRASSASTGNAETFGITCYQQVAAPNTPAVPTGLVGAPGIDAVSLGWNSVYGATSYEIYASSLPGGLGMAPIGSSTQATFKAAGLIGGTPYTFAVTELNAKGMSLRSQTIVVTPTKPGG